MARGKYKTRKQNRDATQLAEDLAAARAQLAAEQARLSAMRERAAAAAALRAELADAVAARDAVCAPQLERIAADRDVIRASTRQLDEAVRELRRHSQKITDWGWETFGPESFYALLSGNRATLTEGVVSTRLDTAAAELIQRARGLRTTASVDFTAAQKMALATATAAATGVALPDGVSDVDGPAWDAYVDEVQKDSAAVIAFKSPPPWLDIGADDAHPVSQALGANPRGAAVTVDAAAPVPTAVELSTGSAALRDAATAAGAAAVADALIEGLQDNVTRACDSHIPAMVASGSAYPAPADAAALQAWYAVSALGAWGRVRTETNGRIAVAAAAAVPFWLPPGHTIAYLDSEPLTGEDIDDMRLPFAQVLVTFAEPARLPATAREALADDPRLRWIDHLVGTGKKLPDVKDMVIAGTDSLQSPTMSLWDAIGGRGAHVEAVLLLADAHGHLDDLFAWCVAIPSYVARGTLGRWVIPASRSATGYANLVANAAAAAAWADWHRPGHGSAAADEATSPEVGEPTRQQRPEDTVHVLNVTATTSADDQPTATGEPTGRTTAPHRRRGHWRRQHFGPGRAQIRRVRIAPVMVNAGRLGADRPQIYRLPAPTT
ncbi:hypothetical protein A5658_03580 [Mycobacterium sp. 1245111.1]|uniref:hypothetical protein n=1 Tax=Mycobacterium sp. 1245111.1 TaxID=1834073 RepID=UPI0007FC7E62|nr:hypothetical protein [Mycobacterium sp. 1245111.1]OBK38612.1 hypothetical protein A5658_03580 [Mycobacterium sp. 1245111.1]